MNPFVFLITLELTGIYLYIQKYVNTLGTFALPMNKLGMSLQELQCSKY